jgi:Fic family protein
MAWTPITDLPENWQEFVSTEVASLAATWAETYLSLQEKALVEMFHERLRREWSIETGIIERIYTIDRGTTRLLIEQGIDAALIPHGATNRPVGEVIQIIQAQRAALDGLFAFVAQRETLTLHYIRTLHQVLTQHQHYTEALDQFGNIGLVPLIKGDWKRQPNNPIRPDGVIHEYCPPEQVQSEMERLLELHAHHLKQAVSPEVAAAWLHHRCTQIHPFQDGNGRVARCLATLVLLRAGRFPLVINRDQREEYISALEAADAGDIGRLVRLFDEIEKRAYLNALAAAEEIAQPVEAVTNIIESIAERYQKRQQARYDRVFSVARQLQSLAKQIFDEYAALMQQKLMATGVPITVRVGLNSDQTVYWYQSDIVSVAKKLGYYANLTRPRLWVRLRMEDEGQITTTNAEIVVSFHYLGKENRGIMLATAFLTILHATSEEYEADVADDVADTQPFRETHPLVTEGFIVTHTDETRLAHLQNEFRQWLDQAIALGLAQWERQL